MLGSFWLSHYTIITKLMANMKGIERLPQDTLREIMIRVAAQSGGDADLARAFSICKTFRSFVEDGDVLKAVSFTDLFPCLPARYEIFLEVGGLVTRCAKAGHSKARFILSKVVLVSTSLLLKAKPNYSRPMDEYHKLEKAAELIEYISADYLDLYQLVYLVRNFLSAAKIRELCEMRRHVEDFLEWYIDPGKDHLYVDFLIAIENFCLFMNSLDPSPDTLTFFVNEFNELCNTGYRDNMMKDIGVDEEVFRSLVQHLVHLNDDIDYVDQMGELNIFAPLLKVGSVVQVDESVSHLVAMFKEYMMLTDDRQAYIKSSHGLVLTSFDAIFDIQQSSS